VSFNALMEEVKHCRIDAQAESFPHAVNPAAHSSTLPSQKYRCEHTEDASLDGAMQR